MYLAAYESTSQPAEGYDYECFALLPEHLKSEYTVSASTERSDNSYTLTFNNKSYAGVLAEGKVVFTAKAPKGVTLDHWEYELTSNKSPLIANSGNIYPGSSVDFAEEPLMNIKAVFEGTPEKQDPVVTPPKTIEGLKYNGSPQTLCTQAQSTDGQLYYALGNGSTEAPEGGWSRDLPSATNAGDYYI